MKKVFLALAVVAMFSFVACGGSNTETTDSTSATEEQVQEPAPEETTCGDTTAIETPAEEGAETEAAAE